MQELIPISKVTIGGKEVNAVDGRKLYVFLEIGRDFSTWMKDQIESFGFKEHIDFELYCSPETGSSIIGMAKEYMLTISMAKELSMVQRTPRGKEARLYFIDCEERFIALSQQPPALPSVKELAMMVIKSEEAREEAERKALILRQQNEVLKPKAEVYDKCAGVTSAHCNLRDAAKQHNFNPLEFNQRLHELQWITKNASGNWVPYQDKVDRGLLVLKMVDTPAGIMSQTFITPRGMIVLASELGNPKKKKNKKVDPSTHTRCFLDENGNFIGDVI